MEATYVLGLLFLFLRGLLLGLLCLLFLGLFLSFLGCLLGVRRRE